VVYQDAAIVYGSSDLGARPPLSGQHGAAMYPVRMTGIRGAGRWAAGAGGSSSTAIVGLGLLPIQPPAGGGL